MAEIALEKDIDAKQERLATVALLSDRSDTDTQKALARAAEFVP